MRVSSGSQAGRGLASLLPYGVFTLYSKTDAGNGFREPAFTRNAIWGPQITISLLTGFTFDGLSGHVGTRAREASK